MSITLEINSTSFEYPETGDEDWGSQATGWAAAVTTGMLQKAGGDFSLQANVDFGTQYGLIAYYFGSHPFNPADISTTGTLRLASSDTIAWRSSGGGGNVAISKDGSDRLLYNGEIVPTGLITDDDIDQDAGILQYKLFPLATLRIAVTDASGFFAASGISSSQLDYLDLTSSAQTQLDARLSKSGGTMTGVLTLSADPLSSLQAATKAYVDNLVTGLQAKTACRLASTGNVVIASALENGDTLDGVAIATGDRILLKNQTSSLENGIYVAPASGAASRATDMDTWTETLQAYVFITAGSVNAGSAWLSQTTAGGTIGVTALPFTQFSATTAYSTDGQGIELTGSQFSLELDGTTLSKSASGLKVNAIANAQIGAAAAIAVDKLAALTASRAAVSDGSGFLASATTTATEIGYVNGVTSAIQTQVDAKIAKTLTSSTGDMIYASSANTPARLAVGTNGYIVQSNGTIPVWTDPKISTTWLTSDAGSYSVGTSYTALTLVVVTASLGSPCVRSSNTITFAYTGQHDITLYCGNVDPGTAREMMCRLRNTTDSTTLDTSCSGIVAANSSGTAVFYLRGNVTDIAKIYEIQLCASGSGVVMSTSSIGGATSHLYQIKIDRPRQ